MHNGGERSTARQCQREQQQRTLQPIARLKATSGVSSLCFVSNNTLPPKRNSNNKKHASSVNKVDADADETKGRSSSSSDDHDTDDDDESSSSSVSDSDEGVQFQCRSIIHKNNQNNRKHNMIGMDNNNALHNAVVGGLDTAATFLLATCHNNGPAKLWDLRHQTILYEFGSSGRRTGPGLALRRISASSSGSLIGPTEDEYSSSTHISSSQVLYQTRDEKGTVSLHDLVTAGYHSGSSRGGNATTATGAAAPLVTMETHSQTFCAASPCVGDQNLVALPSHDAAFATIRDWRMAPTGRPAAYIHGAGDGGQTSTIENDDATTTTTTKKKQHGMLTSLAMLRGGINEQGGASISSSSSSSRPILACGMEDGNVFFHDLAMRGAAIDNSIKSSSISSSSSNVFHHHRASSQFGQEDHVDGSGSSTIPRPPAVAANYHLLATSSVISLSPSCSRTKSAPVSGISCADPILTLDLAQSALGSHRDNSATTTSFVAVAGLAGHAADLGDVPLEEQGRIAIIKGSSSSSSSLSQHDESRKMALRLRARVGPNYYQNDTSSNVDKHHSATGPGFAGISVCRWRPDGRIFAAGGWDKRVRIYDRATSNNSSSTNKTTTMLAVLKGHEASVTAVDWAPDAKSSGLLATGATDGSVCVWSSFGVDR
jgi:WD domain, G-beta repeat